MNSDKKVKYGVKRTINLGNFESIAFEFSVEREVNSKTDLDVLVKEVESFIENKEDEIRKQLG